MDMGNQSLLRSVPKTRTRTSRTVVGTDTGSQVPHVVVGVAEPAGNRSRDYWILLLSMIDRHVGPSDLLTSWAKKMSDGGETAKNGLVAVPPDRSRLPPSSSAPFYFEFSPYLKGDVTKSPQRSECTTWI
ncbi:hypothetical protein NL676_006151 [Syzygium grande]|nr:hypothetical protein NL676_006151 [Syzygium grande]